jgi:solute carrier family 35 protein E1
MPARATVLATAVAAAINFVTYSAWTMINKLQFMHLGVRTPMFITAVQMFISGAIAFVVVVGFGVQRSPQRELFSMAVLRRKILPLGAARAVDIGCGNFALSLVSVALQQVIKSTLPLFVCLLSVTLQRRKVHRDVWVTLVPIVCGTIIASYGEMTFSVVGVALALTSCFGRAFKAVINSMLLTSADNLQPLEILLLEAPTTGALIAVPAFVFEGLLGGSEAFTGITTVGFSNGTRILQELHPAHADSFWAHHLVLLNVLCGVLMFANQASYITIIQMTSAISCQVLMNVKMLMLIGVSLHVFGASFSWMNVAGTALATCGCFLYAFAVSKSQDETRRKKADGDGDPV